MPGETRSPDPARPATHRKAKTRRRRYGYLLGWLALTTGTIVLSSLGLQAAFKADGADRAPEASAGQSVLSSSAPRGVSPSPSPSPSSKRRIAAVEAEKSPERRASKRPKRRPPRPRVEITSPGDEAEVSGEAGVLLKGTATGLGDLSLQIFDLADNGRYYPGSVAPVTVHEGRWSFRKRPIGRGSADVGRTFVMIAALADSSCRAALRSATPNHEGIVMFGELPSGCREMDSVRVVKTAA